MLALLMAIAVIALTILALLLAGVVLAVVTGIVLLNLFAMFLGLRARSSYEQTELPVPERWRPTAFRSPPAPPLESEHVPQLRVYRR